MNLLLDTHIALWAINDSKHLPKRARALIADERNLIWVSVVSLWEIAIKHSLLRKDMPIGAADAANYFERAGFQSLPVDAAHAVAFDALPPRHADPFDRMLVAQALVEPLRLLTHDETVASYSEQFLLV